jgi:hypothetical protein
MPFGFLAPKDILNYLAFHSFLEDVISATRRLDNIRNLGKGTLREEIFSFDNNYNI